MEEEKLKLIENYDEEVTKLNDIIEELKKQLAQCECERLRKRIYELEAGNS